MLKFSVRINCWFSGPPTMDWIFIPSPKSHFLALWFGLGIKTSTQRMIIFVDYFFFSWPSFPLAGSRRGCWSLSQLRMVGGRLRPWKNHQFTAGPPDHLGGLVPCSRIPQQCSEGEPAPVLRQAHHQPFVQRGDLTNWTNPYGLGCRCPFDYFHIQKNVSITVERSVPWRGRGWRGLKKAIISLWKLGDKI